MQIGLYLDHLDCIGLGGLWRIVSEDSGECSPAFPADCLHGQIFTTARYRAMSTVRYSEFPANSQIYRQQSLLSHACVSTISGGMDYTIILRLQRRRSAS